MKALRSVVMVVILGTSFLVSCAQTTATKRPFQNQIEEYKKSDERAFPPKNSILFVGSSSIRLWKGLKTDFPGHTVINRGFGGSGLDHATMYAEDIIIPYHPKQIVIYSGENDVAGGKVTAGDMIYRFKTLFKKIRGELPDVHILYISMKPSPSRKQFLPVIKESNRLIREFLATQPKTAYVDIYSLMLDKSGNPRPELFVSDELHMNRKGYEIWKAAVEPELLN